MCAAEAFARIAIMLKWGRREPVIEQLLQLSAASFSLSPPTANAKSTPVKRSSNYEDIPHRRGL